MTTIRETPSTSSAAYKAAALIDACGPQSVVGLFAAVDFGVENARQEKLDRAMDIGWLTTTPAGSIDLTEATRKHFERPSAYVGQITPAQYRGNVFASSGLSKKYIPSRRGQRNDIPAWSVRSDPSFQTKA